MSLYITLGVEIDGTFCKYACEYGLNDNREYPNCSWSIKQGCLIQFSIRWFYTWLEVMEIIFYHRPHTWINGVLAHGKHDLDSIARSSLLPHVCHKLLRTTFGLNWFRLHYQKNIWQTQGDMVGQNQCKKIMTRDDFIRWHCLFGSQTQEREFWHLHKNLTIFMHTWIFNHSDDVFYFQDVSEVNGN